MQEERKENKYKIEEIIWNDCRAINNEWQQFNDIMDFLKEKPIIKSVGYTFYEDNEYLIIISTMHNFNEEVNGGMIIYKPQIISRRIISNE